MRILKVTSLRNYGFPKKFLQPKKTLKPLKIIDNPITSNLRSWYRDAGEKLNDIYLDQTATKASTYVSGYNKDAYEKLPKAIKDALKPSDVSYTGHISQDRINELWEAAKKAHVPGVYGPAPIFKGAMDSSGLDYTITSLGIGNPDAAFPIGEIGDHIDGGADIASEAMNGTGEHGSSILEFLSDLFG